MISMIFLHFMISWHFWSGYSVKQLEELSICWQAWHLDEAVSFQEIPHHPTTASHHCAPWHHHTTVLHHCAVCTMAPWHQCISPLCNMAPLHHCIAPLCTMAPCHATVLHHCAPRHHPTTVLHQGTTSGSHHCTSQLKLDSAECEDVDRHIYLALFVTLSHCSSHWMLTIINTECTECQAHRVRISADVVLFGRIVYLQLWYCFVELRFTLD